MGFAQECNGVWGHWEAGAIKLGGLRSCLGASRTSRCTMLGCLHCCNTLSSRTLVTGTPSLLQQVLRVGDRQRRRRRRSMGRMQSVAATKERGVLISGRGMERHP